MALAAVFVQLGVVARELPEPHLTLNAVLGPSTLSSQEEWRAMAATNLSTWRNDLFNNVMLVRGRSARAVPPSGLGCAHKLPHCSQQLDEPYASMLLVADSHVALTCCMVRKVGPWLLAGGLCIRPEFGCLLLLRMADRMNRFKGYCMQATKAEHVRRAKDTPAEDATQHAERPHFAEWGMYQFTNPFITCPPGQNFGKVTFH